MSLPASPWLNPPSVYASDPADRGRRVTYEISQTWLETHYLNRRRTPIFKLWAHVVGQLPPINNISKLARASLSPTLTTLEQAVSCYRGIRRPHGNERSGASVVVYALKPLISITYEPDMVCVAKAIRVPANTLLTVQVRPIDSLHDSAASIINGVVTRLEFVSSDARDALCPAGWFERYDSRLW
jgi:hypothetical protein